MTDDDHTRTVAAALGVIHERGEAVRERELDTALAKLDARDELDEETQAVLESLSERLVASVLEPPSRSLVGASADGDPNAVRTAMALFERDGDPDTRAAEDGPTEPAGPGVAQVKE